MKLRREGVEKVEIQTASRRPISFLPWVQDAAKWEAHIRFDIDNDRERFSNLGQKLVDEVIEAARMVLKENVKDLDDEEFDKRNAAQERILWQLVEAKDMQELQAQRAALVEYRDAGVAEVRVRIDQILALGILEGILPNFAPGKGRNFRSLLSRLLTQRSCVPYSKADLLEEMLPAICGSDRIGHAGTAGETDTAVVELPSPETTLPPLMFAELIATAEAPDAER